MWPVLHRGGGGETGNAHEMGRPRFSTMYSSPNVKLEPNGNLPWHLDGSLLRVTVHHLQSITSVL